MAESGKHIFVWVILVDTICTIGYSTADAAIYTALQSQADSNNIFLEFSSTVKQAEGVVCIECPVAKESDACFLSLSVVV